LSNRSTHPLFVILLLLVIISCDEAVKESNVITLENWSSRKASLKEMDSLEHGKTYLSVYSQIYSTSENRTHNLTVMVSMRNMSDTDTVYIRSAKYYGSKGNLLKSYFEEPIFLAPLETSEIIIDEADISGGTGSNFLFEWMTPFESNDPHFEAVMNSTLGKQGLSFITEGKRIQ